MCSGLKLIFRFHHFQKSQYYNITTFLPGSKSSGKIVWQAKQYPSPVYPGRSVPKQSLMHLFPPCLIPLNCYHIICLVSVPLTSAALTFSFLSLILCLSFPTAQMTCRCRPRLSDPPFLCGRMGWGHSSTALWAKRGKSAGLIQPSFPMAEISK